MRGSEIVGRGVDGGKRWEPRETVGQHVQGKEPRSRKPAVEKRKKGYTKAVKMEYMMEPDVFIGRTSG